ALRSTRRHPRPRRHGPRLVCGAHRLARFRGRRRIRGRAEVGAADGRPRGVVRGRRYRRRIRPRRGTRRDRTQVPATAGSTGAGVMDIAAANTRAARAFVQGLARARVTDVCISPGSRSTPLTVAFAEQGAVRPSLHLDEPSPAFLELGLARATGRAVALVCTSGTAAANFLPAVAEANLGRIPLVVCTTDRPPHLRDTGAPQTMDQVRLYGTHVRWAADLPLPSDTPADDRRFAAYGERAVRSALGALPGPVHVNLPFDEPLLGPPEMHPGRWQPERGAFERANVPPSAADVRSAAQALASSRRPLIVAGPETGGL